MRSVLHKDRVRVRILRHDRKGRPEGRVLDILERRKSPIIGRLLHEGGQWIVAPEDSRYGQDILIPKNATASAAVGQVVSVELTEPPSLHSQPVGRVAEVLGEIDDAGMEIEIAVRKYEVPHQFSARDAGAGSGPAREVAPGRPQAPRGPHRRGRWSPSTAKTRATSTTPCTASPSSAAAARRRCRAGA
jgi:ribonuclease R